MTTGEKIAALRREHKLSQEALGEKLGLSRQAVSKWEADQAVPTMDNLMELSRLFGVPVDTLLRPDAPFPAAPAEDGAGKESEDAPAAPETPSAPRQPRRNKAVLIGGAALASADGELNICSPNSDGLLSIIPVFEEQTGIKVKVESIGTGDCMKRIGSEIAQEYSTFDLMYGGSLANYVANADLFQDYVSDQDQYLMDAYKNTRGYCTNYTIDGSVLLVNTDMLKEMGIEVNGYADLLQPELVGKIASADPASSSSAFCQLTNMLLAMGGYEDDAAWQYVQDLFVGQQVAITSGSSAVYKGVYNGEYAVGLTYEDPCVTLIKDGATNIKVVYPVEGTVFLPAQIGIVKNAKNVENAKAFVDFMLSEEAQRFLAENTTSRNVREVEYKNDVMTPLADIKLIYEDSDYVIAHTSELKEKVQDIMMDM